MKALTLWQPWASLIALGVKTVETRSWATSYRGPLAIHAAKKVVDGPVGDYCAEPLFSDVRHRDDCYCDSAEVDVPCQRGATRSPCLTQRGRVAAELPTGAVVATCTLVDCVPILAGDWAERIDWADLPYPRIESRCDNGPDFPDGWLDLWHPTMGSAVDPENDGRAIPDQATYGDFGPGRFAWLLANITPLPEPVPAKGGQRIWNWTPA